MNLKSAVVRDSSSVVVNSVLRNTYILLSVTLLFSALSAAFSMTSNAAPLPFLLILLGYIGLPMIINMFRNSYWGLVLTFVFTGFVGWTLGPILNSYIHNFTNGGELILMALGSTGLIFLGLSAIAMNPKRDFSQIGGFLAVGACVALIAMIANIFLRLPALQLTLSVVFALVSGGMILFQTNMIVRGGERNYITATITLYISILNIFLTLLQLLGLFAGSRD
ncbi:MAG: BAX inhibitor protein [Legionellales bacterium]|nr:MAG: BAX inhibitor protein [Legionellales bacterium]